MHPTLQEVLGDAEAARRDLSDLVEPLTSFEWQRRPAAGGWSVGEVVEHLALVEDSSVRALFRGFRAARDQGLGQESSQGSMLQSLDRELIEGTVRRLTAPPMVSPSASPMRDDVMRRLGHSRDGLRLWSREADGYALSEVVFPHPALGPLNLYQWVLFIGMHERRHLRQIRQVLGR